MWAVIDRPYSRERCVGFVELLMYNTSHPMHWTLLFALTLLLQNSTPLRRTGVVTGVLRGANGAPVEGARVAVEPADGSFAGSVLESIAQTGSDGSYRLENVSPGRYRIVFGRSQGFKYHPGVSTTESATVVVVVGGDTVTVADMVLDYQRVSGRIVDAATGVGRPVANLIACCDYQIGGTNSSTSPTGGAPTLSATVSEDGAFSFAALPRGNITMQAADPSIITSAHSVRVEDRDITDLIVKVSRGVAVEGQVVDRAGTPVSGVTVRLRSHRVPEPSLPTITLVTVAGNMEIRTSYRLDSPVVIPPVTLGPDGRFAFPKVLPDTYALDVYAPGGNSVEREVEIGPMGSADLRVELPFSQIEGRIVAADGGVLPTVRSVRFISALPDDRIFYSFPDADGRFLSLLGPGTYRVTTDSQDHFVRSITVGSKDLGNQSFVFDGVSKPEIVLTVER